MNLFKSLYLKKMLVMFILTFSLPGGAFCEESPALKGIEQYKQENYEEAIELLKEARAEDPASSLVAFMLGMAYKRVLQYENALPHLEAALSLEPKIREAVLELAFVYFRLNQDEDAEKWLSVAKSENMFPAKRLFLEGLIFQKQGKTEEAVAAFEAAKAEDPSMTQSSDYNIALSWIKAKKLKNAREKLQAVVLEDPNSDLSEFARRYQTLLDKQIADFRSLRLTFGVFGQYDSNVVLKSSDSSSASNVSNEDSAALATNLRLNWLPQLEGPLLFNAQYSFYGRFHNNHSTSHDTVANSIYIAPGYSFGDTALNLTGRYTHSMLRDPGYKHYSSEFNIGPMLRTILNEEHILEVYAGYSFKENAKAALAAEEERDGERLSAYISWIWGLSRGTFLNLRYEFSDENAEGQNWKNQGHRMAGSLSLPIGDSLKLQVGGDIFSQEYDSRHTTFGKTRKDMVYQGFTGLTWNFYKSMRLVSQFTYTRADSNIAIYDYDREIYSLGLEYDY